MRITVITICLNSEKTIERTIVSVINQTYPDIEYIIVDGKSNDRTVEIINNYRANLQYLISEYDDGIYQAMNKGILLASGEVICILNSDDCFSYDGLLEDVSKYFLDTNVDAVFGDVVIMGMGSSKDNSRYYDSSIFCPGKMRFGFMPAHPALFLRSTVYERFGLFDDTYKIAGDFEFLCRIFHQHNISYKYIRKIFVDMLGGGISSGLVNKITIAREIIRACKKNGIKTNYLYLLFGYIFKKVRKV